MRSPANARRRVEAEDLVVTRRRTVQHWQQELVQAVRDGQSLAGITGWIARLTGSYESQLQQAERKAADARAKIDAAKRSLAEAEADLDQVRQAAEAAESSLLEGAVRLEEVALDITTEGGPAAAKLGALDAQLARAQQHLDEIREVFRESAAMRATLGGLLRAATSADDLAALGMVVGGAVGRMATSAADRDLHTTIAAFAERAERYEDACAHVGLDVSLPRLEARNDRWMVAELGPAAMPWMGTTTSDRLRHAQDDMDTTIRLLKDGLDDASTEVDRLADQRDALLRRRLS